MVNIAYIVLSAVGILGISIVNYGATHPIGASPMRLGEHVLWDLGFQFGIFAAIAAIGIVILHPSTSSIVPMVSCGFVAVTSAATVYDSRAVGLIACSQAVIFAAVDNGEHWKWFIVAVTSAGIAVAASGVMVYARWLHRITEPPKQVNPTTLFNPVKIGMPGFGNVLRRRARAFAAVDETAFL